MKKETFEKTSKGIFLFHFGEKRPYTLFPRAFSVQGLSKLRVFDILLNKFNLMFKTVSQLLPYPHYLNSIVRSRYCFRYREINDDLVTHRRQFIPLLSAKIKHFTRTLHILHSTHLKIKVCAKILNQWAWFSMSTKNFIGSCQNSTHSLLDDRLKARSAMTQGSCVFNSRAHRVPRDSSYANGIYARDERHAMILVPWIETFIFIIRGVII